MPAVVYGVSGGLSVALIAFGVWLADPGVFARTFARARRRGGDLPDGLFRSERFRG